MIDIHTHILPMLDDGAQSVEEALEMLAMAYEDGIDVVVLTPHMAYPYGFKNPYEKTRKYFKDFKQIVQREGIPIHLHLGMELLYSGKEDLEEMIEDITAIHQNQYVLVEFFFDCEMEMIFEAVKLLQEKGYEVIVAHPERYECIQSNLSKVKELKQKGVLFQMNAGSLEGIYGQRARECVYDLLDMDFIDMVASDAHNIRHRLPILSKAYRRIADLYGRRRAEKLFIYTPEKVVYKEKGEKHEGK